MRGACSLPCCRCCCCCFAAAAAALPLRVLRALLRLACACACSRSPPVAGKCVKACDKCADFHEFVAAAQEA